MALTLTQRHNLVNANGFNDACTPMEKADAALKYYSGLLRQGSLNGGIDKEDLSFYSVHTPSDSQITEWCNRVADHIGISTMTSRMASMFISYPAWDTEGESITDANILLTTEKCIAASAKKI